MITNFINNIEYNWNNPNTYAVLIPGISFAIQLIQLSNLTPKLLMKDTKLGQKLQTNPSLAKQLDYSSDEKFIKACRAHFIVGLVQCVALLLICGTPLPPLLAITPTLQIFHAIYKSFSNTTLTFDASNNHLHISSNFGFGGIHLKLS